MFVNNQELIYYSLKFLKRSLIELSTVRVLNKNLRSENVSETMNPGRASSIFTTLLYCTNF
jgi:hypothetical protein